MSDCDLRKCSVSLERLSAKELKNWLQFNKESFNNNKVNDLKKCSIKLFDISVNPKFRHFFETVSTPAERKFSKVSIDKRSKANKINKVQNTKVHSIDKQFTVATPRRPETTLTVVSVSDGILFDVYGPSFKSSTISRNSNKPYKIPKVKSVNRKQSDIASPLDIEFLLPKPKPAVVNKVSTKKKFGLLVGSDELRNFNKALKAHHKVNRRRHNHFNQAINKEKKDINRLITKVEIQITKARMLSKKAVKRISQLISDGWMTNEDSSVRRDRAISLFHFKRMESLIYLKKILRRKLRKLQ